MTLFSWFPTSGLQRWTNPSLSLTWSRSSRATGGCPWEYIQSWQCTRTHCVLACTLLCAWEYIQSWPCTHTHRTNTEVVWRTISDFQKDPYTTGLSIFSKITDKILFRSVQNQVKLWKKWFPTSSPVEERRPEEEMAELLQVLRFTLPNRMEYGEQ